MERPCTAAAERGRVRVPAADVLGPPAGRVRAPAAPVRLRARREPAGPAVFLRRPRHEWVLRAGRLLRRLPGTPLRLGEGAAALPLVRRDALPAQVPRVLRRVAGGGRRAMARRVREHSTRLIVA